MEFSAEVIATQGSGHAVVVPTEIAAGLSSRRAPVSATVNGVELHTRVAVYSRVSYLGLRKDLLRSLGVVAGDTVTIVLTERAEPEALEPEPEPVAPAELTEALSADPAVRYAWDDLDPTHRREYVRWVAEGAEASTRTERVARLVKRLSRG